MCFLGVIPFGRSTGAFYTFLVLTKTKRNLMHRPLLLRYKTCTDAASVIAMQEVMLGEMQVEQDLRGKCLIFVGS